MKRADPTVVQHGGKSNDFRIGLIAFFMLTAFLAQSAEPPKPGSTPIRAIVWC
jgi:hypothetical protein